MESLNLLTSVKRSESMSERLSRTTFKKAKLKSSGIMISAPSATFKNVTFNVQNALQANPLNCETAKFKT